MPYPEYTPNEPWIKRMSAAELRERVAKDANKLIRYRARAEEAESLLARLRMHWPTMTKSIYGWPSDAQVAFEFTAPREEPQDAQDTNR